MADGTRPRLADQIDAGECVGATQAEIDAIFLDAARHDRTPPARRRPATGKAEVTREIRYHEQCNRDLAAHVRRLATNRPREARRRSRTALAAFVTRVAA